MREFSARVTIFKCWLIHLMSPFSKNVDCLSGITSEGGTDTLEEGYDARDGTGFGLLLISDDNTSSFR